MGGGAPSWMPGKKQIDKVTKATKKVADEFFEERFEKPWKKLGKEGFDTVFGTTDEERRAMLYDKYSMGSPEVTPEVTPEVVPDDITVVGRGTRRSKRKGAAGTIMEEYGITTAKPIAKAVERA